MLAVVLITTQLPIKSPPPMQNVSDKFLHLLTFSVLSAYFCGLVLRRHWWRVFLFLFLYGVALEGLQYLGGMRSPEFRDVLANSAGIAIGWLLSVFGLGSWCTLLESRLARAL